MCDTAIIYYLISKIKRAVSVDKGHILIWIVVTNSFWEKVKLNRQTHGHSAVNQFFQFSFQSMRFLYSFSFQSMKFLLGYQRPGYGLTMILLKFETGLLNICAYAVKRMRKPDQPLNVCVSVYSDLLLENWDISITFLPDYIWYASNFQLS